MSLLAEHFLNLLSFPRMEENSYFNLQIRIPQLISRYFLIYFFSGRRHL